MMQRTSMFGLLCGLLAGSGLMAGNGTLYKSQNETIALELTGEWESTTMAIGKMTYWQLSGKETVQGVKIKIYVNAEPSGESSAPSAETAAVKEKVEVAGYPAERYRTTVEGAAGAVEKYMVEIRTRDREVRIEMQCIKADFDKHKVLFDAALNTLQIL